MMKHVTRLCLLAVAMVASTLQAVPSVNINDLDVGVNRLQDLHKEVAA
jgi:hypothetical protein